MFVYQGIFLTATILSVSIVLADIIVQPGYHNIPYYQNNLHDARSQPLPQQPLLPNKQYYDNQMANPQLMLYTVGTHAAYPYPGYQNRARSHLEGYPIYHRPMNYLFPQQYSLPHHLLVKGGRGYVRPSLHPQPLVVHHRFRRSSNTESNVNEADQSTIKYDDDVATKPSLMGVKYKTTIIDSSLLENEPVDTNNKNAKNRRSKPGPFLFGLNPENMSRNSRQLEPIKMKYTKGVSKPPKEKSVANLHEIIIEPTKQTTPTTTQEYVEDYLKQNDDSMSPIVSPNKMITDTMSSSPGTLEGEKYDEFKNPMMEPPSEWTRDDLDTIITFQDISKGQHRNPYMVEMPESKEFELWNWPKIYRTAYEPAGHNFPDPRPNYYSPHVSKDELSRNNVASAQNIVPSSRSRSDNGATQSVKNKLIGAQNSLYDYLNKPSPIYYSGNIHYISPHEYYKYDPLDLAYSADLDYRDGDLPNSLVVTDPFRELPRVLQMQQYPPNLYSCLTGGYLAPTRNFYQDDHALTYESTPSVNTFSPATYYY